MNLFENNNGPLTNSTGKKALRSILDGIYVNPEERLSARTALKSGLSELSANPCGRLQADAIKHVLAGSQLAEDLVSAKIGFERITSPPLPTLELRPSSGSLFSRPSPFSSGGTGGFFR